MKAETAKSSNASNNIHASNARTKSFFSPNFSKKSEDSFFKPNARLLQKKEVNTATNVPIPSGCEIVFYLTKLWDGVNVTDPTLIALIGRLQSFMITNSNSFFPYNNGSPLQIQSNDPQKINAVLAAFGAPAPATIINPDFGGVAICYNPVLQNGQGLVRLSNRNTTRLNNIVALFGSLPQY